MTEPWWVVQQFDFKDWEEEMEEFDPQIDRITQLFADRDTSEDDTQ